MASIQHLTKINTKYPWKVQFVRTPKGEYERETFTASFKTQEEAIEFAKKWERVFVEKGRKAVDYTPRRRGHPRNWIT